MLLTISVSAQENPENAVNKEETTAPLESTISHRVQMGETVVLICKKYLVAPDDIYKLNPDAVNGISQGMVLKVPADKKVVARPKKKQLALGQAPIKRAESDNR